MADWFTQNAPPSATSPPVSGGQDWFSKNAPGSEGSDQRGTPYTVQPQGTAGERLGSNLWENTIGGLVNYGRGIADLAVQGARAASGQIPIPSGPGAEMIQGAKEGTVDQAKKMAKSVGKAVEAVHQGRHGEAIGHFTEAFGHGLGTIPMLGPAAAAAGEKMGGEEGQLDKYGNVIQPGQAPDVAGGLGAGLGQILSVVAPAAGKAAIGKVAGKAAEAVKYKSVLNPTVEQPAVDWAREPRGFDPDTGQPIPRVQLSPGTITGNKFLQAREALTQNRPFGAKEGAQFRRGTEADLQREAGRLSQADQPITPEGAGRLVGSRVQGKATALETDLANQAHPQAVTPETVGRAPAAKMDKIIQAETLKKNAAYEQAWQGRDDPAFSQSVPVRMARGEEVLNDETGQGTGIYEQRPVMQSVSMPVDVRGLKMMAEPIYDQMSIRLTPAEQNTSQGYHALGVLLKGDDFWPAWKAEPVLSGLKSMARLEKGEAVRDVSQGIGAHLIPELQQRIDAAVAATGDDAIRGLQEGRRVHAGIMDVEDIAKQLREKEPVKNFNRLVQPDDTNIDFLRQVQNLAPEHMPAVGRAYLPEIFDRGRPAWESLGPETRKIFYPDPNVHAGIENYLGVRDVARQLANKGGVDQFATMIEPRDGNVDFLRQVQKLTAPEDMDAVGRALIQQQVSRAMREGGFGKTVGLLNWWRELGDQTKQILIRDPGVRTELNHFFKVADMAAHAPNPSGTALVAGSDTMDPRKIVMGWIGSKALFTPRGISILTDSLTPQSPGAAALTQAKIRALAAKAPPEEPPQGPPEEPPTGGGEGGPGAPPPPPPPPGAPPGSGGGAAALQGHQWLTPQEITDTARRLRLPVEEVATAASLPYAELEKRAQAAGDAYDAAVREGKSVGQVADELIDARAGLYHNLSMRAAYADVQRGAQPQGAVGRGALQGGLERNQERIAANRETLTGRPDVESKPVQPSPGLTEKPQAIDNPQNEYQYTTPEGIPVYKSPEGESTPPGGSPDVRLGPGDFLTEKPALHPAPQATPPGSSPGEPAIPPGTAGRAALQGGIERNQAAIEANKAKLTGEPAPPAAPETGGGLYDKLQQAGDAAKERLKKPWSGTQLYSLFPGDKAIDLATLTAAGTAKGVKTLANRAMADMGEWGAARIAGGFIKYPEWSKQMMEDASEVSSHAAEFLRKNMRAVYTQAQQTLKDRQSETLTGKVTEIQKILEYAEAGKEGTYWYKHVKPILQPMFGPNTDLFLNFLAATSPQTPVARNVMLALKAYNEYLTGEPFSTDFEAHLGNLKNAAAGKLLSGLKVGSFAPNLMGDFIKVTVDTWMAKAYGFKSKVSDPQYRFMDYAISQAAKAKGLEPAEMQAAIWTGIKKLEGDPRLTAAPFEEVVKQYLQENPEIKMQIEKALKSNQSAAQLRAKALAAKGQ